MSITKSILLILTLFFLNSCSVHTFTFGDGPKKGYTKVLKQQNFLGGLISENTPAVDELNDEKDYKLVIKYSIVDTFFSILSFGLYTPTTIIIYK
jgi:hypothetical protein